MGTKIKILGYYKMDILNLENSKENLGECKKEEKKRGRKAKKQTEKELMNEYYSEIEKDKQFNNQKKLYENMNYMSKHEKIQFESKFTKPKNRHQEQYVSTLRNKEKKIIVVTGPAGTGKTLFATEHGVRNFLLGVYDKLIFTRPSVSVDEELGFLPGTLEEKMAPWVRPIYDVLYNFISPKEVQYLMEEKVIEIAPLGYMRGRTFKNSWIVADEMQNSTISQMKMLLTRLGENSRLVITGDLEQFDRINELNGLDDFLNKFKGKRSSSISSFEFSRNDIQREEVVKEVLDIYSGDIPSTYELENEGSNENDLETL
jgi:phosphate starvation-inducible PhoH-like protein